MKTIKELSEALNISKVALYKKLKTQLKDELTGHIKKLNNITYIDDLGISIIAESLKAKTNNLSNGYLENIFNQVKNQVNSQVKTANNAQQANCINNGFNKNTFNSQVKSKVNQEVNHEVNQQVKNNVIESPCCMQYEDTFNQNVSNRQVNNKVNCEVNNQVKNKAQIRDNALSDTVNQIVNSFNAQLKAKDEQIISQTNQIEKLNAEICEQNKHIRNQAEQLTNLISQMNELQRNNQVLIAQANTYKTLEAQDTKKSKNFFSRFFHKQQNQS